LEPELIICSCNVITDRDIDVAVSEIMSTGPGLLPTPGVVFRHLNKKMNCCRCAPIAVSAIYAAMDRLERTTQVCPFALAEARARLIRIEERREQRQRRIDAQLTRRKGLRDRNVA
jgi:bacterioferritin-associated ferredoxin